MSSTSNKSDRYKTGQGSRIKDHQQISQDSLQQSTIGEGSRDNTSKKWSNGKVLDELSSFIAEFSYLNNTPKASEEERQKTPSHSYQVYAANTDDNHKRVFNKTNATSNDSLYNLDKPKKSVEWKDLRRNSPVHNENRHRNKHETDVNTTSGEEKLPSTYGKKRKKIPRSGRIERHPIASRSRNRGRKKKSRSRSKRRIIKTSRSPSYNKPQRSRSVHSGHRVRRRRRSHSSKSWVKCMPFKYERTKSKETRIAVKKRPPIQMIRKTEIKGIAPSNSQTIVTLYPNRRPKEVEFNCECDPEFLTDPALPCKCFKCMRKYESLVKVAKSPHRLQEVNAKTCQVRRKNNARSPHIVRDHVQIPDEFNYTACLHNSPCVDYFVPDYYTDNCCEEFGNICCKSVYFKFDSFGQYLDSNITQYFHSILNDTIYC